MKEASYQAETETTEGAMAVKLIKENLSLAVIIYLSRLPSHGGNRARFALSEGNALGSDHFRGRQAGGHGENQSKEGHNPFFEDVFMSRWLSQNAYMLERRRMPLLGLFFEKGKKKDLVQKWQETEGYLSLGYEVKQPSQLASGDYIIGYWDRGLKRSSGCLLNPLIANQTHEGEFKVDYHIVDAKDGKLLKSLYLTAPATYIKKEPGCLNAGLSPKGELVLALVGLGILGGAGYYIKKNFID